MHQTFLGYVTTDLRFWASSVMAIARSILAPLGLLVVLASFTAGAQGAAMVLLAAAGFAAADWMVLVVRMARRIALGLEQPDAFMDRSVHDNALYLHRAYYAGPMPTLRAVRG